MSLLFVFFLLLLANRCEWLFFFSLIVVFNAKMWWAKAWPLLELFVCFSQRQLLRSGVAGTRPRTSNYAEKFIESGGAEGEGRGRGAELVTCG